MSASSQLLDGFFPPLVDLAPYDTGASPCVSASESLHLLSVSLSWWWFVVVVVTVVAGLVAGNWAVWLTAGCLAGVLAGCLCI